MNSTRSIEMRSIKMPTDLTIEKLRVWLLDRRHKASAKYFVIGLSGGIDSAVVAALCARADKANTIAVIMPCHSDPKSEEDARAVAAAIGITPVKIDLSRDHSNLLDTIEKPIGSMPPGGHNHELMDTNLRSRLRMVTLYAIANSLNGIVVGTDNACENYVGFFTKYGDGGVDINPIARYVKCQVRELGRLLGVPLEVVNKTPTADLRYGMTDGKPNTDEAEMGVSYDDLDVFLTHRDHHQIHPSVSQRIRGMHDATHHKREVPYEPESDFLD